MPENTGPTEVTVEPMREDFLLWRCLHEGPLSSRSIDRLPSDIPPGGARFRERNLALLRRLTRIYGACAILARSGEEVVGFLRFYPRLVWDMARGGYLCLQQPPPNGPADDLAEADFPAMNGIDDRTLMVHCMMAGSALRPVNPYLRTGLGSRMVDELIRWAGEEGWARIEADAFEDLPLIYEITGGAGRVFWEKRGFRLVERSPHPQLQDDSEFTARLEKQAGRAGIPRARARDRLLMRIDLP